MSIMDEINREVQRIKSQDTNYGRDNFLDSFADSFTSGQEAKKWNERKNIQRQQMMSNLASGISTSYNNNDVNMKKEKFDNYFNKYKNTMDESTLEMGQMYLDNFKMQSEKNSDFEKQQQNLTVREDAMRETLSTFDRENSSGDEYANEIKKMNKEWLGVVNEFQEVHGERLNLRSHKHIADKLSNGKTMNNFLLQSIRDDEYIDDAELQAWQDSWESSSLNPINTYQKKESANDAFVIQTASKKLIKNIDEYKTLNDFIYSNQTITDENSKTEISYSELDEAQQIAYNSQLNSMRKEIENLDKNYSRKLGISYLDQNESELFPKAKDLTNQQIVDKAKGKTVEPSKSSKQEEWKKKLHKGDLTNENKYENVEILKEQLDTQKENLKNERQSIVRYGTVFKQNNVGFKKMLKDKKVTDKFKASKKRLEKQLEANKKRLEKHKLEEIKPQGQGEALIDFLNPTDQFKAQSIKSQINSYQTKLNTYNQFEEFLKTYGNANLEYKKIMKEINTYYK